VPHGGNQCPLCFTVRLGFILILLRFAPNDDIIFSCLMTIIDPLQATSSSIWPCRRASPAISNAPVIKLPIPSVFWQAAGPIDQHWCCFSCDAMRQRAFCVSPTLTQSFRSSVFSVGAAFVVTPLDELPFASSLMLIQWCSSLVLVLLFLQRQATNGFLHFF